MSEGTRLTESWQPLPEVKVKALSELRINGQDYEDELSEFCAYWKRKKGVGALKVNWDRTWWNWLKKVPPSQKYEDKTTKTVGHWTDGLTGPQIRECEELRMRGKFQASEERRREFLGL